MSALPAATNTLNASRVARTINSTCWVQILDAPIDLRLLEKEAVR
jgi:hypothetical protein